MKISDVRNSRELERLDGMRTMIIVLILESYVVANISIAINPIDPGELK